MTKVIKRDCSEVDFDKSKISTAILKAMKNGSGIVKPKIADDIAKVEEQLNQIEEDLASIGSDFTKGQQLLEQQSELNAKLEHLMERWEYLSEIAEG